MDKRWLRGLLLVPLVIVAGIVLACGDDDEDEGDMEHVAPTGVVSEKPADATQVDITLQEWAVQVGQTSVPAGKIYFLAENAGPDHPHEFVIIRTDLGPLDLPFDEEANLVPEEEIDLVDEIEEFAPHSSASLTVELTPGKYLFICNIADEDPEIGSHYKKGMVAAFTVE